MLALYLLVAAATTALVGAAGFLGYAGWLDRYDKPGRHRADDVIWTLHDNDIR